MHKVLGEVFGTILAHQLRDAERGAIKLAFHVGWKGAQWSSVDGTEEDLFEMYAHHGIPGEMSITTEDS